MNYWPFVIAAYAITFAGTIGLVVWAWRCMSTAERRLDEIKRK